MKKKTTKVLDITIPEKKRLSVAKSTPGKRSKREEGLESIVGDAAEEIMALLESSDMDSATTLLHKRLLQTLVDTLPYAEHNVRATKGQKGVYQLNSLITSLREILTDVQSSRDRGRLGEVMVERVIRPVFLDIGMEIVQEFSRINQDLKLIVSAKHYPEVVDLTKKSRERLAQFIQAEYGNTKVKASTFMQG